MANLLRSDAGPAASPSPSQAPSPQLLKVNRPQDRPSPATLAAAAHYHWYDPRRWALLLGRGGHARVSPLAWERVEERHKDAATSTTTETSPPGTVKAATSSGGLPEVDIESTLSDEDVKMLPPAVQGQRSEALGAEKRIHIALSRLEENRLRYFVLPTTLTESPCWPQLRSVSKCYQKANEKDRRARATFREAEGKKLERLTIDGMGLDADVNVNPWWASSQVVSFEALHCGEAVEALKKCTEEVVMRSYTERDLARTAAMNAKKEENTARS